MAKSLKPTERISLKPYTEFLRGEQKVHLVKNADPVTNNFKLLIDYTKPYGLLADEEYTDSALAYLKRIGEHNRYEMLKHWISSLKTLVKDYEFLFMTVEGLDVIQNMKPGSFPVPDDKVVFGLRETVDYRVQGLLATYQQIWYDYNRGVEVLPINLRRFDLSVVVFPGGYFNMLKYDNYTSEDKNQLEHKIFPTIKKLSDEHWSYAGISEFNHMIYDLIDASIDVVDSGKSFAAEPSNEQGDMVRNQLALNYKFCRSSGTFNNIYGEVNYGSLLSVISAMHKTNEVEDVTTITRIKDNITDLFSKKYNEFTSKDSYVKAGNYIKDSTMANLDQKLLNMESALFDKVGVTGNIIDKISVEYGAQMIQNTINLGINTVNQRFVNDPLTKVNNLLFDNFSNDLYTAFKPSEQGNPGVEVIENDTSIPSSRYRSEDMDNYKPLDQQTNIRFENINIYKRGL